MTIRETLPTLFTYWDRRTKARQNRLPKHLRAPGLHPIFVQQTFNLLIIGATTYLMWNRDEFPNEAAPAAVMVISALLLFYTVPNAFAVKRRYAKIKGRRWAKLNFYSTWFAVLSVPICLAYFLP